MSWKWEYPPRKWKWPYNINLQIGYIPFVCFTATMTRILTQKVPQIPRGACIVTGAVSLYTLTDKEPLLSSDSRRCGWIIYGGIPTHWLPKTTHTHRGQRRGKMFCVCLLLGFLFLLVWKMCASVCTYISLSAVCPACWISHTFFP